jgi:hypothetical protein
MRRVNFIDQFENYIREVWQSAGAGQHKLWSEWKVEHKISISII